MKTIYENWGGHRVKLTWLPALELEDDEKVTSVHGVCFDEDQVLLVKVENRGYTFPGGHVEEGETPAEAFHREAMEEGSVRGEIEYLGAIEVSHEENPHFHPNGKYPKVGYQLFYKMDITDRLPFSRDHETSARIWVEPSEIPYVIEDHDLSLVILDEALKGKGGTNKKRGAIKNQEPDMKRILVAGATGYLGRYAVKALKEQGYWVRVLVRNPRSLRNPGRHLSPQIDRYVDEIFQGEVTKPESIKGVCEGVDFVFTSVGITRQRDEMGYQDVDYQGNVNLLREAKASGIEKFMYISVFKGNELHGQLTNWKERFVSELKNAGIPYVVIRPTGYYSDMGEFLGMAKKGRIYLFGDGLKRMNPIHGADLADFCVRGLKKTNVDLNIGGPQVFTHRVIAELAFQATGQPEKITRIPAGLINAALVPFLKIRPQSAGPFEFLYHVMTNDMVAPAFGTRDLLSFFNKMNI